MSDEFRHWAEIIATRAIDLFGQKQVVCTGWSPSGIYHIGNSREAVTCNAIYLELLKQSADSEFIFVIDDFDPMDKIPFELKQYSKQLREYLGHPLVHIPDFTETEKNYAEYFARGPKKAFEDWGFDVSFLNASQLYAEGRYNDFLDLFIEEEEHLQELMERISGSPLRPIVSIICQNCGNGKTAKWTGLTEKQEITYICETHDQYKGCGHVGSVPITSHQWKLKWRLDWAARQSFLGVTVEPSGKDHSVAGGSIDTALAIHEEIIRKTPPILERYGFITLKGKKFSGSKGGALPASKIAQIMPPSAYLYLVYRSDLLKDISFNPQSMEYPTLMDEYDTARRMVLGEMIDGREKEIAKLSTAAQLAMTASEKNVTPANVKYAELALIHQTSLFKSTHTVKKLRKLGKLNGKSSEQEIISRLPRLEKWLDEMAPPSIKFSFLDSNSADIGSYWTQDIKQVWITALERVTPETTSDHFTSQIRDIAMGYALNPKEFYQPFYRMLTGEPQGPNASNLVL
ncbi:MAG: lysine--tRNA ligase, partial [Candidatus Kariarchaeaceae archaeon]